MTPSDDEGRANPQNSSLPQKIFSESETRAALARLKAIAATRQTGPVPPPPPETGEMPGEVAPTEDADELTGMDEALEDMKPTWDKLRAEGVPIEKRPLLADLPWVMQFQFQAETDPTGKDMEWWKAHKAEFSDL